MANLHWLNGVNGDWNLPGNWDLGTTPSATDAVLIDAAGSYSVAISTADSAGSLTVNAAGATVIDTGNLTLGGALAITAGSFNLAAGGQVTGGTLSTTGGSFAWNGGTLSGATYQGVLDLTAAGESLIIANGLTTTGAGGIGAGTINANGAATSLNFLGIQTLDNVIINAGNAAGPIATALTFADLTLGAHATLNELGGAAAGTQSVETGTSLTNNGTIQSAQGGGATIATTSLVNNGLISDLAGATLLLQTTNLINNGTIAGVGGIGVSATNLTNNGVFTDAGGVSATNFVNNGTFNDNGGFATTPGAFVNNGVFNLGGYNTYLALVGTFSGAAAVGGSGAGSINMIGSLNQLRLMGSQTFDAGTITLSGTSEQIISGTGQTSGASQLILGAKAAINHLAGTTQITGGQIVVNGAINASGAGGVLTINPSSVVDNGSINVSGGDHVIFGSAVTGTGQVTIGSGGIGEFAGSVASTDAVLFTDTSNATLRIDLGNAASFKSTIQGFSGANTIDLTGITATAASWSNGVLTVSQGAGTPITLALAGNYAGAVFHLATDGILATPPGFGFGIYPGTNITVTGAGAPVPPPAARVYAGTGATVSAAEGTAIAAPLASFTDSNATDLASQFTAAITWGDGTTTAGTVTGSNGSFSVAGSHAYADEGSFLTSVAVTNSADHITTTLAGSATATEADVLAAGAAPAIAATAGLAFTGTVASFTDSYLATSAADLAATITWGDGSSSAGTVSGGNGSFSVAGSHAWAATGSDAVSVTLTDVHGTAAATANTTATVASPYAGTGATLSAAEGSAVTAAVASFTDANTTETAAAFTASILWGDGTTTTGTVTGSNGSFSVAGSHAYADEGSFAVATTVTHTADAATLVLAGSVTATEADVISVASAPAIAATAGKAVSGTLATFSDSYTANIAADFTATIAWGDGTSSAGTITDTAGVIAVAGSHTYASAGTDAVSVTLADAHGTASAIASTTATIAAVVVPPPPPPPAGSLVLTTGEDHLTGGAGNDSFIARSNTLSDGDTLNGGLGTNTLMLSGGGVFNLSIPDTLANIQVVSAQDGAGTAAQTVTLRENTHFLVNVASDPAATPGAGITIIGADNADIITLGKGIATVVLGVGETANGGGGTATYQVNGDTISDTINGGTGSNTLLVTGGGDIAMGANITGITNVQLAASTHFIANSTAGMAIAGSAAGGDTITLGAASQSVVSGGTGEHIRATAANAGAIVSGLGAGSTLEITTGGTATLGDSTSVGTVKLDAATNLMLSKMSFLSATGSSGADSIAAGATFQMLTGGGGADTLTGFAGGYDVFKDTASGLNGDLIRGFLATDSIDVTNLAYVGAALKVTAGGSNTLVTLSCGAMRSAFTLTGSYSAAGFHLASDNAGGVMLTHT